MKSSRYSHVPYPLGRYRVSLSPGVIPERWRIGRRTVTVSMECYNAYLGPIYVFREFITDRIICSCSKEVFEDIKLHQRWSHAVSRDDDGHSQRQDVARYIYKIGRERLEESVQRKDNNSIRYWARMRALSDPSGGSLHTRLTSWEPFAPTENTDKDRFTVAPADSRLYFVIDKYHLYTFPLMSLAKAEAIVQTHKNMSSYRFVH